MENDLYTNFSVSEKKKKLNFLAQDCFGIN